MAKKKTSDASTTTTNNAKKVKAKKAPKVTTPAEVKDVAADVTTPAVPAVVEAAPVEEEITAYDFCLETYQVGDKIKPWWSDRYGLWSGNLSELVEYTVGEVGAFTPGTNTADGGNWATTQPLQGNYKWEDFNWYEVSYKKSDVGEDLFKEIEKYVKQGSNWVVVSSATIRRVIPRSEIFAIALAEDYDKAKKVELANFVFRKEDLDE